MPLNNHAFHAETASVDDAPAPRTFSSPPEGAGAWYVRLLRELAIHDWLVIGYLTILTIAVGVAAPSPEQDRCLGHVTSMLAFCLAVLALIRGGLLRGGIVAPLLYRFAVYGTVQISYFELRELLPVVNPKSLDAELSYIDAHILHFEPSLFLDRFVTPAATEWFAFFYFGYFALLAVHVLPMVFFSRRLRLTAELALGMITVYAAAHTVYMLVPGYGPVRFLADRFQNPLPSGFWLDAVLNAVQSGGAQKDIFPSLHTAGPVFLSLFSFRHRDKWPFKYTWPFVAFFSANIVIATMFLRWHYLIDVLAGIALSTSAFVLAGVISGRELEYREQNGLQPAWLPIVWRAFGRPVADREPG
jgi:PAP2 superfamily protein